MNARSASASNQTHSPSAASQRKALQNTGLRDFRQYQFVDTHYTQGYTWWFLSVTVESAVALAVAGLPQEVLQSLNSVVVGAVTGVRDEGA
jgi:hypothetical protein